jgi:hypothetical protein
MSVESTGVVVPFAVFVERQERLRRLAASVRGDAPAETKTKTDTPPPTKPASLATRELRESRPG